MGEGSEGSLCIARAINKSGVGELVNTGGRESPPRESFFTFYTCDL